jgi:glycine cleavage system regulatory protein
MQAMVLTIIGKDQPGLVDDLAKAVTNANGNWLRSSFCQLSGHFAGFVEVLLPPENHNSLVSDCHALSNLQITLLPANHLAVNATNASNIKMKVTGNDRQGIVSDVSGALKRFDLNIIELQTSCDSAPNWGSPLFSAVISVQLPQGIEPSQLKQAIEDIADDLIVDITKS